MKIRNEQEYEAASQRLDEILYCSALMDEALEISRALEDYQIIHFPEEGAPEFRRDQESSIE